MNEVKVVNRLAADLPCRSLVETALREVLESRPDGPWRLTISASSHPGCIAIDLLTSQGSLMCMSIAESDSREEIAAHLRQFLAW